MNSKQAGIYSITSLVNGKRYVGSAVNIYQRWHNHKSYLKHNKHVNKHLQNHYNKYGEQDLIYTLLEVVERGEKSLTEFKQLLLEREQTYLDNWSCCEFNCLNTAGSSLGHRREDAKYYTYNKKRQQYITHYTVNGGTLVFNYFIEEYEALKDVEFLKTLTEEELLNYFKQCRYKKCKNYYFNKKANKYIVVFTVNGKKKSFGNYLSEKEAIDRVNEVRLQLPD